MKGNHNAEQLRQLREELESLHHPEASSYTDLELDSYLTFQRSVSAAAKALIASEQWRRDHPVTIADVAPFVRAPPGHAVPPACLVCLEDGKGSVARDQQGRPIILMMGVIYGTEEELQQQVAYALQRAAQYRLPHQRPDEVCFVTEVQSRETKSLNPSFRIPDAAVRSLFDVMKSKYPGSQFSVVHFCGLPSFVAQFFKVVKPFVSEELWSRLKLKSSFAHLKAGGHVAPASLLPEWDKEGTFYFDLDMYVEWRAQEEDISMDALCARGEGRKYEGIFSFNPSLTLENLLGTPEKRENVLKRGWVEKQGSGLGLFASNRWKSKYMVLQPGLLVYFESSKISSTNEASKWIPIDESSSVQRVASSSSSDEKKAVICLQSAGREYVFGCKNDQEADEWMQALQKQCYGAPAPEFDDETPTSMISPLKVSSLCVGDFQFEQDRRLSATLRQQ